MKRMVTEEEIAEIASQSTKPLYRYNGSLGITIDDEAEEETYSVNILLDFVSNDKGEGLEDEDYVAALAELVRLAFDNRGSIYVALMSGQESTHKNLASYFLSSKTPLENHFSAGMYISGRFINVTPNGTYKELVDKFFDAESYSVTRTNLQTGEQYFREV